LHPGACSRGASIHAERGDGPAAQSHACWHVERAFSQIVGESLPPPPCWFHHGHSIVAGETVTPVAYMLFVGLILCVPPSLRLPLSLRGDGLFPGPGPAAQAASEEGGDGDGDTGGAAEGEDEEGGEGGSDQERGRKRDMYKIRSLLLQVCTASLYPCRCNFVLARVASLLLRGVDLSPNAL